MFEIIYDYDDGWTETRNISETFTGTWDELQDYLKSMRRRGCYNISAASLDNI